MFNPFLKKPWFSHVCGKSLLKTQWEKKKLLVTSNFFFSHSVFYPFRELSAIFIKHEILICKLFSIWKGLEFVVWERVRILVPQYHFCTLNFTYQELQTPSKKIQWTARTHCITENNDTVSSERRLSSMVLVYNVSI